MSTRVARLLLVVVVILGASTLGFGLTSAAADVLPSQSSYGVIARAALPAVGQQQGQCRSWVQRVVASAFGVVIGSDYRLGYLQAGAVEVSAQAAVNGDIIQLANDADSGPAADYPGLHTAIILDNKGGGNFRVIDSNFNFDGIVRVHEYNPASHAARFAHISWHIYHLGGGASAAVAPVAPPTPHVPMSAGMAAIVAADGDCLRVRSAPSTAAPVIGCLPTDARVIVQRVGGNADGYAWDEVSNGTLQGWAADVYLKPAIAANASTASPAASVGTGQILFGTIPMGGVGLIVFGGGTTDQLVAASGCPRDATRFWTANGDETAQFLPSSSVDSVNAAWQAKFASGIPPRTLLLGSCQVSAAATLFTPGQSAGSGSAPLTSPPSGTPTAPSVSSYIVAKGDTLSSIAERLHPANVDFLPYLRMLEQLNGLDDQATLSIAQTLVLPAGDRASAAPARVSAQSTPTSYTVAAGDTLLGISVHYCPESEDIGVYLAALERLNGLDDSSLLSIGRTLTLPRS